MNAMKITIELRDSIDPKDTTYLIYDRNVWRVEGPPLEMRARIIWLMHSVQDLTREFKRRNTPESKNVELPNKENPPSN